MNPVIPNSVVDADGTEAWLCFIVKYHKECTATRLIYKVHNTMAT